MLRDLLVHELLLCVLLWLGILSYGLWKQARAAQYQRKQKAAQRPTRSSQEKKPFAGLTQKPLCAACEQAEERGNQASTAPPPLMASTRGRPREVATQHQFCPKLTCRYYGWVGRGNIRANGHPSGGPWRQLHCIACGVYFLETNGTPFHGKRVPAELLVRIVTTLAEGLGIRAVARVFEVDANTVLGWLIEAADHLQAFSRYFLHDVQVNQVQLDELFVLVNAVKAGQVSDAEAIERLSRSPHWVWVALDPESKLLLAIDVGERTLAMAQRLVHRLKQVLAPGRIPLFLTDGFKAYATALLTHCGHWVQPPRRQLTGPAPKLRWMPLPELLYAQVVKQCRRRRLVGVRHRVVFGTLARVTRVLVSKGWQINTAFIERVNLAIRQHVAAVGRRVLTLCKREAGLRQQLALYQTYHNFCLPHASLRQLLPQPLPTRGTGSAKKWRPWTPAMAAGLTDHVWTLQEVLKFCVPLWPQPQGL